MIQTSVYASLLSCTFCCSAISIDRLSSGSASTLSIHLLYDLVDGKGKCFFRNSYPFGEYRWREVSRFCIVWVGEKIILQKCLHIRFRFCSSSLLTKHLSFNSLIKSPHFLFALFSLNPAFVSDVSPRLRLLVMPKYFLFNSPGTIGDFVIPFHC